MATRPGAPRARLMARIWTKSQIEEVFAAEGKKLNVKSGAAVAALLFLLWLLIEQTNEPEVLRHHRLRRPFSGTE